MKLAMDVVVVAVSVVMKTIFAKFCVVFVIVLKLYLYVYAVVAVMNRVVMNLNAKIVVLLVALIIVCVVIANTMKKIIPYNLEEEVENDEGQDKDFTSLSRVYTSNNISYKGEQMTYKACKTSNPSMYRIHKDNKKDRSVSLQTCLHV